MSVIEEIAAERERQKTGEGWSDIHDDHHKDRSLIKAAACYIEGVCLDDAERAVMEEHPIGGTPFRLKETWPWAREWWKPKTRRRDLVRAAALVVAEIERMDRESNELADIEQFIGDTLDEIFPSTAN